MARLGSLQDDLVSRVADLFQSLKLWKRCNAFEKGQNPLLPQSPQNKACNYNPRSFSFFIPEEDNLIENF